LNQFNYLISLQKAEMINYFQYYGSLLVDWPHKTETKSMFPPKGYAFLIFDKEQSVQDLIRACTVENGKLYVSISSSSMQGKHVQVKPWCLNDSSCVVDETQAINLRRTVFVGGVPRPLRSRKLLFYLILLHDQIVFSAVRQAFSAFRSFWVF
jgi:cytoplasmic polyadenylation element-binding protein